ncbi:MAG TPA: hypothetical protein EYP55_07420, partial [Anaerolineae bacterium]|nr:hypothetical protein [Anaerolineae bacterium]
MDEFRRFLRESLLQIISGSIGAGILAIIAAIAAGLGLVAAAIVAVICVALIAGLYFWLAPEGPKPPPIEKKAPPPPTLFSLPPAPKNFVGREEEQAELLEGFHDPQVNLLLITGTGGIGKTHLAAKVSETLEDGYRVRWVKCRERDVTLEAFLVAMAQEIGEDPLAAVVREPTRRPQERVEALLSFLERESYVFFIDDYHLVKDRRGMDLFLLRVAQHAKRTNVFLMARRRPEVVEEWKLPPGVCLERSLRGLKAEEAQEYLARHGLGVDGETARGIWARCGEGDPTAMQIFATRVTEGKRTVRELLERLPVYAPQVAGEWLEGLLADLPPEAVEMAESASVFRAPVPRAGLAHVYGEGEADGLVDELVDWYVLEPEGEAFAMKDLLRDYCYHQRLAGEQRAEYHRRAGAWYLSLPGDERVRVENQVAAFEQFYLAGGWEEVIALAYQVRDPLVTWGLWDRATEICQRALEAARETGEEREEAAWLHSLGVRHHDRGDY